MRVRAGLITAIYLWGLLFCFSVFGAEPEAILRQVDQARYFGTLYFEGEMQVQRRFKRTKQFKIWQEGDQKSFIEFVNKSDAGTKFLKLEDQLWLYYPQVDDVIKIGGYMLRDGFMGSDFSYDDVMDEAALLSDYTVQVHPSEKSVSENVTCLLLTARRDGVGYPTREIWVDTTRYVILKMNLFAQSGVLLKEMTFSGYFKVDRFWFPKRMRMRSVLRKNSQTDFYISNVKLSPLLSKDRFSKKAFHVD